MKKYSPKEKIERAKLAYERAKQDLSLAYQEFGKHFRSCRQKAGLSLRAVAEKTRLSAPYISDVELGRRNANQALLDFFKE